jgi:O-antigen/teichoic acid export membrane protein
MNKNLVFYTSNVVQLGLRFIQMVLVARFLSNTDLGVYYAAAAYPQLLSRIFDLGLPHAVRYYILQDPYTSRSVVKVVFLFTFAISLPVTAFFFFLDHLPLESGEILSAISHNYFVLSLYCVLLVVNSIWLSIVLSFEKFQAVLITSIVPYIIFIAAVATQYYLFELEVNDILFQLFISEFVALVIYLMFILRVVNQQEKSVPIKVIELMRYALHVYPSGFLKVLTTRLDKVVLSFIAAPAFIGYYSVLMTIRDISIFPITSYGQLFMNKLSQALKNKSEKVNKLVDINLLGILLIYAGGFAMFLLVDNFIIALFFKEVNAEVLRAAFFLLLSIVPLALSSFLSYVFLTINRPKYMSYSALWSTIGFYGTVYLCYDKLKSDSFFYASLLSTLIGFLYLFIHYKFLLWKRKL